MGCNFCVPCFKWRKCGICVNCLTNSKGNRRHRKCVRLICLRDRKQTGIVPRPIGQKQKYVAELLKLANVIEEGKKLLASAQNCENLEKFSNELENII